MVLLAALRNRILGDADAYPGIRDGESRPRDLLGDELRMFEKSLVTFRLMVFYFLWRHGSRMPPWFACSLSFGAVFFSILRGNLRVSVVCGFHQLWKNPREATVSYLFISFVNCRAELLRKLELS